MDTPTPRPSESAVRAAGRMAWLREELGPEREEDACLLAVGWLAEEEGAKVELANGVVCWDANQMTTRVLVLDGTAVDYQGTLGEQPIAEGIMRYWGVSFQVSWLELDLLRPPGQWDQLHDSILASGRPVLALLRAHEAAGQLEQDTARVDSEGPGKRL